MQKLKNLDFFILNKAALQAADSFCEFIKAGGVDFENRKKNNEIQKAMFNFGKMLEFQFLDADRFKQILIAVDFNENFDVKNPQKAAMQIFKDYFSLAVADLSMQKADFAAPQKKAIEIVADYAPFILENFEFIARQKPTPRAMRSK